MPLDGVDAWLGKGPAELVRLTHVVGEAQRLLISGREDPYDRGDLVFEVDVQITAFRALEVGHLKSHLVVSEVGGHRIVACHPLRVKSTNPSRHGPWRDRLIGGGRCHPHGVTGRAQEGQILRNDHPCKVLSLIIGVRREAETKIILVRHLGAVEGHHGKLSRCVVRGVEGKRLVGQLAPRARVGHGLAVGGLHLHITRQVHAKTGGAGLVVCGDRRRRVGRQSDDGCLPRREGRGEGYCEI